MKEGEKFAADYLANYPDAIRTDSQLVYHETETGTGAQPTDNCTVTAHYTGKFVDGKVFDSSYNRGEPLEFDIDKVIEGWTEGLKRMRAGGKATLVIPHTIGYGEKGSPPRYTPRRDSSIRRAPPLCEGSYGECLSSPRSGQATSGDRG